MSFRDSDITMITMLIPETQRCTARFAIFFFWISYIYLLLTPNDQISQTIYDDIFRPGFPVLVAELSTTPEEPAV